ncbi:uncharacterized protein METZ01_LOCUS430438, partial [marine metagenome]
MRKINSELLINLGLQPISNRFLKPNSNEDVPHYPIRLMLEKDIGYIYLENPFPIKELKPRYDWLTCFEPENHLDDLVQTIIKISAISKQSIIGAYSFKDDSMLRRLKNQGFHNLWRIDPRTDLGIDDNCASIETYQNEFTIEKAQQIKKRYGNTDILIIRHVIEHAYDLPRFFKAIKSLIKADGYIVWELPDCERAISDGDCTTIWEEHVYYFTSFTFKQILQNAGFTIIHYESVPYPLENSIIAITQKNHS